MVLHHFPFVIDVCTHSRRESGRAIGSTQLFFPRYLLYKTIHQCVKRYAVFTATGTVLYGRQGEVAVHTYVQHRSIDSYQGFELLAINSTIMDKYCRLAGPLISMVIQTLQLQTQ